MSRNDRPKQITLNGVIIAYTMYEGAYKIRALRDDYGKAIAWEISEGHDVPGAWLSPTYYSPAEVDYIVVDDDSLTLREAVKYVQRLHAEEPVYVCKVYPCFCKSRIANLLMS